MGILDGPLAQSIYDGFKGKLLSGTLRKNVEGDSGALDGKGDPIDVAPTDYDTEGFVDNYDDAYRARAGIPQTDVMVGIFGKSIDGVIVEKDDIASFTRSGVTTWYQVRRAKLDPAGALWDCQSFVIPEPAS